MKTINTFVLVSGLVMGLSAAQCIEDTEVPEVTVQATLDSNLAGTLAEKSGAAKDFVSQTPNRYSLAVLKAVVLTEDGLEKTIFDAEESPEDYETVDVSEGAVADIRTGTAAEGTYTAIKVTLLGIGQDVDYITLNDEEATAGYALVFSDFDNTGGLLTDFPSEDLAPGDFLLYDNSEDGFQWLSYAANGCGTSPDELAASEAGIYANKPESLTAEQTITFSEPVTIESGQAYNVVLTFGSLAAFSFNDLDDDGLFQPSGGDCQEGGTGTYRVDDINGPDFEITMPTITAVASPI